MVRRDVVAAKVGRARAWLNDAASRLRNPLEAFLADPQTRDLSLFYLFLAIQECIDLAAHWVADEGWGQPDDAGSAFDMLADRNVIDRETATALRAAVGLRNRIAQGSALLDYERVHREAAAGMSPLRRFLVAIAAAAGIGEDERGGGRSEMPPLGPAAAARRWERSARSLSLNLTPERVNL